MNKESLDLVIFMAELANGVANIGHKWEITDAFGFFKAAMAAPAAFKGIDQVDNEFNVWTPEEKQEVLDTFIKTLRFENTVTEAEAEEVFVNAINLAKSVQNLIKK